VVRIHCLDFLQRALCIDQVEKSGFVGFIGQSCGGYVLPGQWNDSVAEKLDVMMKGFGFLERITHQAERLLPGRLQFILCGGLHFFRLLYRRLVFAAVEPWEIDRESGHYFAGGLGCVVVAAGFHPQVRIGDPLTPGGTELCLRRFDLFASHQQFRTVGQGQVLKGHQLQFQSEGTHRLRSCQRRLSWAVHDDIQL